MSKKPKCPLIGQDGNIFNLMGIASKTLKRNGMYDEAKEMCSRITSSGSYYEALNVIGEYVEITFDLYRYSISVPVIKPRKFCFAFCR